MNNPNQDHSAASDDQSSGTQPKPYAADPSKGLSEDWTAAILGLIVLIIALLASLASSPPGLSWQSSASELKAAKWESPLKPWLGKPGVWSSSPDEAFRKKPKSKAPEAKDVPPAKGNWNFAPILGAFLALVLIGATATKLRGKPLAPFLAAFPCLLLLATLAYILSAQSVIKHYNLEYALWALLVGLLISNTIGTPAWLRPAVTGELYIKIGLVLLGAGVLLSRLLALGVPGVFVSWVVTPVVLISTYLFGQKVLRLKSKSLNMVISADMSVCGVSAAIATAAACRAKKEELSLAVGMSLSFTVVMMIILPMVVQAMGLDPVIGGAWIGGTIDATGAVVAAGEALGDVGSETAVTVKMIQNILIGIVAFFVAIYWTRWVEVEKDQGSTSTNKVGVGEIWRRFPKFVLGFVAASVLCSILFGLSGYGELWVNATVKGATKTMRGWLFCLAFVCIGLDTNFRQLLPYLRSGKPFVLYLCGQTLNILLTLAMAYLMFGVIFKAS